MKEVILLSGVQGCGKTALANRLETQHSLVVADMGTMMFERLASEYELSHRDQLRGLPASIMAMAFRLALSEFMDLDTLSPKVLVTHLFPRRLAEMYFPQDYFYAGRHHVAGIALLISDPLSVLNRRARDVTRARAGADIYLLAAEQKCYVVAAMLMATEVRVPCWVVSNPDGGLELAAHMVASLIFNQTKHIGS